MFQKLTKWFCFVLFLTVIGFEQPARTAGPVSQADAKPAATETVVEEINTQLKINKETLFKGASRQLRIVAANVMLFSNEPLARQILVNALLQPENTSARAAVCKALSDAKVSAEPIKRKEDFIKPLLEMLKTSDSEHGKAAAEAFLLFAFEKTFRLLEKTSMDTSLPSQARINVMYALKLQPDIKAILTLIKLLDDSDDSVAATSENILRSLGMPVGKDIKARKRMVNELKRKGRNQFLRDWLIRQESQMHKMSTELEYWEKMYLTALDKLYDNIGDDAAKGKFLAEHLRVDKATVRLWTLEKVSQWHRGTKSNLPSAIGPILVELVSDVDRDVRLKTAKLLSLMVQLNSAQKLLEQIEVEHDDEVKTELFAALGAACHYAFSPNSGIKLAIEIRKQTLELAAKYVTDESTVKSQKGAEVIRKLLSQNGLSSAETAKYLNLLAGRYATAKSGGEDVLRGELLTAMAGLCAQNSYKAESSELFGPIFEEALGDEADLIRQIAVDGLIYIDKAKAIKLLRQGFVDDKSNIIRTRIIELAGEVGSSEDLVWLAERLEAVNESEAVWRSMLKIFDRSQAVVLEQWMGKLGVENSVSKLNDVQVTAFFETAERKASSEDKYPMLERCRAKLAQLYKKSRAYEQAAEYFGTLRKTVKKPAEKKRLLGELLEVYLMWPNIDAASQLVNNSLLEGDLDANDVIIQLIDSYLAEPFEGTEAKAVLAAFSQIKPADRPQWAEHLKRWAGPGTKPIEEQETKEEE